MCIKIESPTAVHVVISRAVIKRGGGGGGGWGSPLATRTGNTWLLS